MTPPLRASGGSNGIWATQLGTTTLDPAGTRELAHVGAGMGLHGEPAVSMAWQRLHVALDSRS